MEKQEHRTRRTKSTGGSLMVWECMSAAGVGSLKFICEFMNHKAFIKLLKKNLASSAEKMGLKDNYKFMQDNDPMYIGPWCKIMDFKLDTCFTSYFHFFMNTL